MGTQVQIVFKEPDEALSVYQLKRINNKQDDVKYPLNVNNVSNVRNPHFLNI